MRYRTPCIALLMLLFLIGGCDNVVEPISQERSESIAVYGLLDMRTDQQLIRLESLRSTILAQPDEQEGITVRSIAVGSGTFQSWQRVDSTDIDGTPILLFGADFMPEPGTTYRVDVFRNGNLISEARTTIPPRPNVAFGPVGGEGRSLSQTLYMTSLNGAPEEVSLSYTVVDIDETLPITVPVAYGRLSEQPVSELQFNASYGSDRFIVMNRLGRDIDEAGVRFRGLELSFDIPSPEWTSTGATDVTGGLGFFASVGRYTYSWPLEDQIVSALGWIDEQ